METILTRPILALALLFTATTLHPLPHPPPTRVNYDAPSELTQVIHALFVASRRYNAPTWLAFSVAWNESRFRPWAQSRRNGKVIARGLMQISKRYQDEQVVRYLGWSPGNFDWRNPMHSALLGCAMLSDLMARRGLWAAVCSFNCGEGRFLELVKYGRRLPLETETYYRRVLAAQ